MDTQTTIAPTFSTPSEREIVMTRFFEAPPALVFDATTQPKHVRRWYVCGDRLTMPVCEVDLRPGGAFRYVMRHTEGGAEFSMSGVYKEVVRPERIVHTERFNDDPAMETLVTVTLTPMGQGTLLRTHILHDTKASRDGHLDGMKGGVPIAFDRLDALLRVLTA